MNKVPDFLECDFIEICKKKEENNVAEFNLWFDKTVIKLRLKKKYILHQGFRCCYCKKVTFSSNNRLWDLEHIVSEKSYPEHFSEPFNLAVACSSCNTAKSAKPVLRKAHPSNVPLPARSEDYIIPHPNIDDWDDHLKHTHYLIYEGITQKGKNLISMCNLLAGAAEAVGQTADAVEQAVAIDFFNILPNRLVQTPPNEVQEILNSAVLAQETVRLKPLIVKINREICKIEKRRESAWLKAHALAIPG